MQNQALRLTTSRWNLVKIKIIYTDETDERHGFPSGEHDHRHIFQRPAM
jgi:hypothetical protein